MSDNLLLKYRIKHTLHGSRYILDRIVVDLAVGHVKALKKIEENAGLCIYNLGTGHGYSVLDILKNFEAATGVKIPYTIKPRRPGDIATCYCDPSKAKRELGWEAQYGICLLYTSRCV